jgi:hypothetical protein
MDPECSLPCSQESITCPHIEIDEISYHFRVPFIRSILLLSSHIHQIGLFSSDIKSIMLYAFIILSSRILVTLFDDTLDLIYKHS